MKKVITIILLITLSLALSGCDEEVNPYGGGTIAIQEQLDDMQTSIYTQAEVDEMLQDLCWDIFGIDENCIDAHKDVQAIFEEYDTEFYTINERVRKLNERVLELESMLRDFERFEYEDLIESMEYMENDFVTALDEYLIEHYQTQIDALEQRIDDLEND